MQTVTGRVGRWCTGDRGSVSAEKKITIFHASVMHANSSRQDSGSGTGPADPATAEPISASAITWSRATKYSCMWQDKNNVPVEEIITGRA